jgi:hypothetical protein
VASVVQILNFLSPKSVVQVMDQCSVVSLIIYEQESYLHLVSHIYIKISIKNLTIILYICYSITDEKL